jgi:ABC-type branched-subunit amino acid transport system substrate-binding protein
VWPARADDSPIVISQSGHLSGPLAPSFKGTLARQRLALDEFNAKGGVEGRMVNWCNSTTPTIRPSARRTCRS